VINMRGVVLSVGALCLVAAILAFAPAQSTAASEMMSAPAQVAMAAPIKVTACLPKQGSTTWVNSGFAPAYYPAGIGPYWGWGSVYGPTYYSAQPITSNPTLGIDYFNNTKVTMKQIEFGLIARGQLVAEARDVGTFSPGAEIKHVFGLSPNVFPLGTGLPHCVPLKITFADGTKWKNPHLPALQKSIYGKPTH
jgi:hypothetical protein